MTLFGRRDTRLWVLGLGGFASLMPLTFALGTPAYRPAIQLPLGVLVFACVAACILRWRRALPPDLELLWIDRAEALRLLAAPPPPDATRLFITFERDWPRRYRLDVLIDGERAGQLLPGTAMLLTLPLGLRTLQAFLDRPRTAVSETINSIPGGQAGFAVRNRGSRAIELEIHRIPGGGAPMLGKEVRLVRPLAATASAAGRP